MGISISCCLSRNNIQESINNNNGSISYVNIVATGVVISAAAAASLIILYNYSLTSKSGCEKPFLPEDIIRLEILTRLPVKSVTRFQCVYKSWKSLNFDPAFVKYHMAHINLIHTEDDAMIVRCYNCRVPSNASIEITNFFLTLGFDRIKNDYKVIFVSRDDRDRPLVADVYSCNAGSWCKINVSSSFVSRCGSILLSVLGDHEKIIHVNGSIYWKSFDSKYVQTFDIIDEVFRVFPDLDMQDDDFPKKRMILVNLRNSLAQIVHDTRCKKLTYVDVYVLNNNQTMDCGGSTTWIKLYRVGPILLTRPWMTSMGCFSITGTLVFNDQYNLKLLCIDEEKQAISKIKMISFDPSLYRFNMYSSYGFGYTRTLAFVRGMKPNRLEFAHTLIIGSKIVFPSHTNYL